MSGVPVGVLLAGGLSRRMGGGDKALRLLAGRALLAHVLDRVRPQVRAIVLNANGDAGRFGWCGLPVMADTVAGHPGPLAGVLAGMRWAAEAYPECAEILSVPTDTPFLPHDLVARLVAARAASGAAVACAASGGRAHPVVGLWMIALADALEADLRAGIGRVGDWAERAGLVTVDFGDAGGRDPFLNVNAPGDLAQAEAQAAR